MKKLHLTLTCLLLSAVALFSLSSCDKGGAPVTNSRITAANVAKIQPGMDRTQVEALLGAPATSETKDMLVFKKTYVEGKQSVEVIYKNNEVEEVHSTVGAAGSPGADTSSSTTTTTTTTKP